MKTALRLVGITLACIQFCAGSVCSAAHPASVPLAVEFHGKVQKCVGFKCVWVDGVVAIMRGSGTIIAEGEGHRLLVLTNSHLFRPPEGSPPVKPTMTVNTWIAGTWVTGQVVANSPKEDLAAVSVPYTGKATPVPIAGEDPVDGQACVIHSWIGGMKARSANTRLLYCIGQRRIEQSVFLDTTVDFGESGGAVLNGKGELIGVIYGQDDHPKAGKDRTNKALAVDLATIRDFTNSFGLKSPSATLLPYRRKDGETLPVAEPPVVSQKAAEVDLTPVTDKLEKLDTVMSRVELGVEKSNVNERLTKADEALTRIEAGLEKVKTSEVLAKLATHFETVAGVAGKLDGLSGTLVKVHAVVGTLAKASEGAGLWASALPLLTGVGGPAGLGIGLAGFLIARAVKKRGAPLAGKVLERVIHAPGQVIDRVVERGRPFPVVMDTPAPPQQVVTQTHVQQVEVNSHREAYDWATAEFRRKYPGAEGNVEVINSLIEQYLAGNSRS